MPIQSGTSTYGTFGELLTSAVQTNVSKRPLKKIAPYSNYDQPLNLDGGIHGYSRNWGDASTATQTAVMKKILDYSEDLSSEDQAILLGIARIESGFNPDAAATTTSASGVFQFLASTGKGFGLSPDNTFDADANIAAGVRLFRQNQRIIDSRYPNLSAKDRAIRLYAIHHDGPGMNAGGIQIAKEKLIPNLEKFRAIAAAYE